MTITLDQLKGMNLQVGEPIEINYIDDTSKLGYYEGLKNSRLTWFSKKQRSKFPPNSDSVDAIEKVRRLKYNDSKQGIDPYINASHHM
jgi:hypothetical protein